MLALVGAVAGTAVAGPEATTSLSKKKAKKLINKQIKKKAPGLDVNSATTADSATTAGNADTVDSKHATCPGGTTEIRGYCFDTAARAAASSVFVADDTCRGAGGWLPTPMMLRSTRNVLNLGAAADAGNYVDLIYEDSGTAQTMTVEDSGTFTEIATTDNRAFRCVFPLVR